VSCPFMNPHSKNSSRPFLDLVRPNKPTFPSTIMCLGSMYLYSTISTYIGIYVNFLGICDNTMENDEDATSSLSFLLVGNKVRRLLGYFVSEIFYFLVIFS
jgi:hypothetical protein